MSHTLLLSQLGDMTLRAMVIGGNVVALRTGEGMSGGIIGLEADPRMLPRRFPDGSETGQIEKTGHGAYAPRKAALSVVGGKLW